MPGFTTGVWSKFRRFYLTHFRPGYVREQESRRRGECRRCGLCCRIAVKCWFLKDGNHCVIYSQRPAQCRAFPIDPRDLRNVPSCGFHF